MWRRRRRKADAVNEEKTNSAILWRERERQEATALRGYVGSCWMDTLRERERERELY